MTADVINADLQSQFHLLTTCYPRDPVAALEFCDAAMEASIVFGKPFVNVTDDCFHTALRQGMAANSAYIARALAESPLARRRRRAHQAGRSGRQSAAGERRRHAGPLRHLWQGPCLYRPRQLAALAQRLQGADDRRHVRQPPLGEPAGCLCRRRGRLGHREGGIRRPATTATLRYGRSSSSPPPAARRNGAANTPPPICRRLVSCLCPNGIETAFIDSDDVALGTFANDLWDLLCTHRFADLEAIAWGLRQGQNLAPCRTLDQFYVILGDANSPQQYDYLQSCMALWRKQMPNSATQRIAEGAAWIGGAWMARGSGMADTVTEAGWKTFHERLQKAQSALEEARHLGSARCLPAHLRDRHRHGG